MKDQEEQDLVTRYLEDPLVRTEVEREWFIDGALIQIEKKMDELGITRTELADRLKCSAPNVTQLLRHGSNLTLGKLMDIALAIEHRFLSPVLVPVSSSPPWETCTTQQVSCPVRVWVCPEATTVSLSVWDGIPTPREAVVPYEITDDHPREANVH